MCCLAVLLHTSLEDDVLSCHQDNSLEIVTSTVPKLPAQRTIDSMEELCGSNKHVNERHGIRIWHYLDGGHLATHLVEISIISYEKDQLRGVREKRTLNWLEILAGF